MSNILGLVTAAIVGVICNLAIFLGKDVLFLQGNFYINKLDFIAFSWVVISCVLLEKFRLNVVYLILLSLLVGLIRFFLKY
jgi:chromate transporter